MVVVVVVVVVVVFVAVVESSSGGVVMTGFCYGSGISWTVCKQSAPRSRQIDTDTSALKFYRPRSLPDAQPTVSKH